MILSFISHSVLQEYIVTLSPGFLTQILLLSPCPILKHFISSVSESQNKPLHTPYKKTTCSIQTQHLSLGSHCLCPGIMCPPDVRNPVQSISIFPALNRVFGNFLLIKLWTNLPLSHPHCTNSEKSLSPGNQVLFVLLAVAN